MSLPIPEAWTEKTLNDLVEFLDGKRRPIKSADRNHMRGPYPYYGASGIIDWVNDYLFDEDLILLGEDGENILSRNLPLAFAVCGKIWVNNHAHVLRPKAGVDLEFLTQLLEFQDYADLNSGTAQPKLNLQSCKSLRLAVPASFYEQQAIAAALSDADGVVAGLERVIAKKRLIKQGAMQDLLTARRRLPGFSGEWEVKQLGAALTVRHGRSQKEVEHPAGEFPILATGGQIGTATKFLCNKPSVLIGRKGTIDVPRYMEKPFWSVDTLFYTDVHTGFDARFLFYIFQMVDWMSYNEASGVPSLNAKTIENIEVSIPKLDEQQAIASVLSDMDAEIQTLESRLAKAQAVKEGMMQNLLTGRVRLV